MALLAFLLVAVSVAAGTATARDGQGPGGATMMYFFDPDANQDVILATMGAWNDLLSRQHLNAVFQPLQSSEALRRAPEVRYAIVSSRYRRLWKELDLRPALVPQTAGSVHFRKVLVSTKEFKDKRLGRAVVAAAVPPDSNHEVISVLRRHGFQAESAYVMSVAKDIDAMLATTFGDAEAALVTAESLDVLRRINPAAAGRLYVLAETEKILRAPLCVSRRHEKAGVGAGSDPILSFFARLHDDQAGRELLRLLSVSKWTSFSREMLQ